MATLSLDLRERIVRAYDKGDGTRDEIAQRFDVSLGMVKSFSSNAAPRAASSPGIISPDARSSSWPKKLIVAEHRMAIRHAFEAQARPDPGGAARASGPQLHPA